MRKLFVVLLVITLFLAYAGAVIDPAQDRVGQKIKHDREKWEARASNMGREYYILPKNMRRFQTRSELSSITLNLQSDLSSKGFNTVKFETVSKSKIKMTIPSDLPAEKVKEIRELVKSNPNVEYMELKPDFKLMGGNNVL